MKKLKKVYLYKLGRHQEDFEYMFPNIQIINYIVDEKSKPHNGIECIELKNIDKNKLKNLIVICDRRINEIRERFESLGLLEHKHFIFLEELGKLLDEEEKKETIKLNKLKEKYQTEMINFSTSISEMFKKMIYTDCEHNLNCREPFRNAIIATDGFIYPCCQGATEEHIGSLLTKSAEKVWNSTRARLFRLSIINKTYAFCNLNLCRLCETDVNKGVERRTDLKVCKVPEYTVMAFDTTCNLKCKSCRTCVMNENNNPIKSKLYDNITKKLFDSNWLSQTKQLVMATQGEVFFSRAYKNILFSNKLKDLNLIIIHTNGTLLTKEIFDTMYDNLKKNNVNLIYFNVSVDSIEKETYETLRLGGNMKVLKRNLENLSLARKEGKVSCVSIIFVLQRANYKELPKLAKYMIELGFDRLEVQKIFNWGTYSNEEFKEISMFDENDNPKPELVKVLQDPIFQSKDIMFVGNVFKSETWGD